MVTTRGHLLYIKSGLTDVKDNCLLLTYYSFTGFTIWIFYGMTFISVIVLRYTKPDIDRQYKVPLIFGLLSSIVLLGLFIYIYI